MTFEPQILKMPLKIFLTLLFIALSNSVLAESFNECVDGKGHTIYTNCVCPSGFNIINPPKHADNMRYALDKRIELEPDSILLQPSPKKRDKIYYSGNIKIISEMFQRYLEENGG